MPATGQLATDIIDLARSAGVTIVAAESLTGGLLAASLVDVAGASDVFHGSVTAYQNGAKVSQLGVEADLLERFGPYLQSVTVQMARGVRRRFFGDAIDSAVLAVATNGVAGPGNDGRSGSPAGTVFVALVHGEREVVQEFSFEGDRASIRESAVHAALSLMRAELASTGKRPSDTPR